MQNEAQVVRTAGKQAIRQFLQGQTCFSCLRTSGKVVVFDIRIPIQLAFYALVEHGKFQISLFLFLPSRQILISAKKHWLSRGSFQICKRLRSGIQSNVNFSVS